MVPPSNPRTFRRASTAARVVRALKYGARRRAGSRVAAARKLKAGVRTKTMTKKIHTRATPLANRSGTESTWKIVLKPKGLYSKLAKKMISQSYNLNQDYVMSGTAGVQTCINFGGLYTPADLKAIMANAWANNGAVTGQYSQKVFIKSAYQELMIQASNNSVTRLQIWLCMFKRDAYDDHAGNYILPMEAFQQGLKDQTASGTGAEYAQVGARPTDSVLFNQFFKVKKVIYTELAPGQVHYQRLRYVINRPIDAEVVYQDNSSLVGIKGWTVVPLLIAYGEPTGDGSTGATTQAFSFNMIYTTNYHFSVLEASQASSTHSVNLLTTTTTHLESLPGGTQVTYSNVV